jgi:hypothetical protein
VVEGKVAHNRLEGRWKEEQILVCGDKIYLSEAIIGGHAGDFTAPWRALFAGTIRYLYIYGIASEAVRSCTEHVPLSLVRHVQLLRIYI